MPLAQLEAIPISEKLAELFHGLRSKIGACSRTGATIHPKIRLPRPILQAAALPFRTRLLNIPPILNTRPILSTPSSETP